MRNDVTMFVKCTKFAISETKTVPGILLKLSHPTVFVALNFLTAQGPTIYKRKVLGARWSRSALRPGARGKM